MYRLPIPTFLGQVVFVSDPLLIRSCEQSGHAHRLFTTGPPSSPVVRLMRFLIEFTKTYSHGTHYPAVIEEPGTQLDEMRRQRTCL